MASEQSRIDRINAALEKSWVGRLNVAMEKPWGWVAGAVNAVMRDGSIMATLREGIKDIQNKYFDIVFGHNDHSREPGTPLTPLFSDVVKEREQFMTAPVAKRSLPSPSEIVKQSKAAVTVHGPAHEAEKPRTQTPSEIVKDSRQHSENEHNRGPHDRGR